MHPEVRQIGPGACPICGMALEAVLVEKDAGPDPELVDMSRRFWVSVASAVPTVAVAMGDMLPGAPVSSVVGHAGVGWLELALDVEDRVGHRDYDAACDRDARVDR